MDKKNFESKKFWMEKNLGEKKKKKIGVKKNFEVCVNYFLFQKQKLLKIACAAQKSHFQGVGVGVFPWMDRQTDNQMDG